jgi:hypothetical protein
MFLPKTSSQLFFLFKAAEKDRKYGALAPINAEFRADLAPRSYIANPLEDSPSLHPSRMRKYKSSTIFG